MAPHETETESESAAARQAKESLELAFQMSQILDTGLDRHTLSLLMALCDRGANPEALAALVRELSSAAPPTAATTPASTATATTTAVPSTKAASLFPSGLRQP
uniref:Mitotic-spindle organizing protein 1 n=1 Tax=Oryza meridionalis TaxID=40149 RepID=A0A0E0D2I9_9ORYZ